jgi:hypothetical protein
MHLASHHDYPVEHAPVSWTEVLLAAALAGALFFLPENGLTAKKTPTVTPVRDSVSREELRKAIQLPDRVKPARHYPKDHGLPIV